MIKDRCVNILLVDDDKVDAMAIRRSFRDLKITDPMTEAHNGIEALDCLRGQNGYAKIATPHLVLLDLNMPRMGGFEFLEVVRHDPLLRQTLVFVMTTSAAEEDRARAYEKNVAGYVLKHRVGRSFLDTMSALRSYWQMIEFPD